MKCCFNDETSSDEKSRCCSISSECDPIALPVPPGPPSSRPPSVPRSDYETLSEKYWGEILERTVSSSSLQALQRAFGHSPHVHQPDMNLHKSSIFELNNSVDVGGAITGSIIGASHIHHHHQVGNLSNFSSSEPRLCEHFHHDINCAKSKASFNEGTALKGLSNI